VQLLPCQQPGKRQRLDVHARVAARAAAAPPSPVLQSSVRPDDVTDAAAPTPPTTAADQEVQSAVKAVWRRLYQADLSREQYGTAYRILHGSLYVGGFLCHIGVVSPEEACCSHPACAGTLETLSHAFLLCPAVAPAADWLCRVFGAVIGCQQPPVEAGVLLGDCRLSWVPPAGSGQLWTALRVAFLHTVWQLRCRRSLTGRPFDTIALCAAVVAAVRAAIQRDWARATKDLVKLSGACPEWFRGHSPTLRLHDFKALWAVRGVLCTVTGGEESDAEDGGEGGPAVEGEQRPAPRLTLRFSLAHPVAASGVASAGGSPSPTVQAPLDIDPG
jgi:hypothetical protein